MLFYQIYTEITTFFDQEMFGSVPIQDVDIEMFDGKNWRQDVRNDV